MAVGDEWVSVGKDGKPNPKPAGSTTPTTSGASGGATHGTPPERLDLSVPMPSEDPDSWDTVWLDKIEMPPLGAGRVKVKIVTKAKLDKKGGAGKKKPKTTKTGHEQAKVTIEIWFIEEALPAVAAACATLVPGSGPYKLRHPKATLCQVGEVMIEGWDDAPDPDDHGLFHWKLNCVENDPAAQKGSGGKSDASTPGGAGGKAQPGDKWGSVDKSGKLNPKPSGDANSKPDPAASAAKAKADAGKAT